MNNQGSNNSIYDITIRLLFLLLIIVWCLILMYPFFSIILWSLILSFALLPLHKTVSRKLGGRKKLASSLIVFSFLFVFILPSSIIVSRLVDEVKELKSDFTNETLSIPTPNEKVKEWPVVGTDLYAIWQSSYQDLELTISKYKEQISDFGKTFIKGILGSVSALVQIIISFVIAGVLLATGGSGEPIRKFFRKVAGERGDEFADTVVVTVGSVVKGVLGVAVIMGLLHGLIFVLADIPFAGLWALLVFVLVVLQIPALFVTLPIVFYIFTTHDLTMAIVWTAALVVAGLSDNILKPILLGVGAPVPMVIIFIGVIGGFVFSGFIGLFTGAIIMSLGYKLFIAWINTENSQVKA